MSNPKNRNHLPVENRFIERHLPGRGENLPRTVLPKTVVPAYLDETPLQEQTRHDDSYHLENAAANHGHSRGNFPRPSLADNLDLIADNLSDDHYFKMNYDIRQPYEREETTGITGLTVAPASGTLDIGGTLQLTPTVTGTGSYSQAVTYRSSSGVVTVSASGLVTAVSEGSAVITVTAADAAFTAVVNITVNAPDPEEP